MAADIEGTATRIAVGEDLGDSAAQQVLESPHASVVPDEKLVKIYVKIRDAKKAFVKAHEQALESNFDAALRRVSAELKARLQSRTNQGLKTEYGTVYLAEVVKPACADWGIFYDWAKANDCLEHFLEQRLKAGEVKTYMEKHAGELPPGVSVFRELEARVRKPKAKPGSTAADTSDEE